MHSAATLNETEAGGRHAERAWLFVSYDCR